MFVFVYNVLCTMYPFVVFLCRQFISDIFSGPIKVFAGGDHSFLIMSNDKTLSDFRIPDAKKQILTLTLPRLAACEMFKDDDTVNQVSDFIALFKGRFINFYFRIRFKKRQIMFNRIWISLLEK